MNIYSPVFGVINQRSQNQIGIYIRGPYDEKEDPHSIFSPITGLLKSITYTNIKPIKSIYKAEEDKLAELNLEFEIVGVTINVKIYVGKGYVTDTVKLFVNPNTEVVAGQYIGQILIGSYCILESSIPIYNQYEIGTEVQGGISLYPIGQLLIPID